MKSTTCPPNRLVLLNQHLQFKLIESKYSLNWSLFVGIRINRWGLSWACKLIDRTRFSHIILGLAVRLLTLSKTKPMLSQKLASVLAPSLAPLLAPSLEARPVARHGLAVFACSEATPDPDPDPDPDPSQPLRPLWDLRYPLLNRESGFWIGAEYLPLPLGSP